MMSSLPSGSQSKDRGNDGKRGSRPVSIDPKLYVYARRRRQAIQPKGASMANHESDNDAAEKESGDRESPSPSPSVEREQELKRLGHLEERDAPGAPIIPFPDEVESN
jgi:hypothetical protein